MIFRYDHAPTLERNHSNLFFRPDQKNPRTQNMSVSVHCVDELRCASAVEDFPNKADGVGFVHVLTHVTLEATADREVSPDDVLLVCKHWMSSRCLSDAPSLLCPAERLEDMMFLPDLPTEVLPLNKWSDKEVREYKKTARTVGEAPWLLAAAQNYLLMLIEKHVNDSMCKPPTFLDTNLAGRGGAPVFSDQWKSFAPGTPKRVVVNVGGRPPKKRRMREKGPSAAIPPPPANMPPLGCSKCRKSPWFSGS